MFNKVILVGRLTNDPQSKQSQSGNLFCNFSLATNYGYKDKKETTYHNITAFNKTAEFITQYVRKGSLVLIEGRISAKQYEQEGVRKTYHSIIVESFQTLEKKSDQYQNQTQDQPVQQTQYQPQPQVQPQNPYQGQDQDFGDYINQGF